MQNSVNHRIFERKWRSWFFQEHVCLSVVFITSTLRRGCHEVSGVIVCAREAVPVCVCAFFRKPPPRLCLIARARCSSPLKISEWLLRPLLAVGLARLLRVCIIPRSSCYSAPRRFKGMGSGELFAPAVLSRKRRSHARATSSLCACAGVCVSILT